MKNDKSKKSFRTIKDFEKHLNSKNDKIENYVARIEGNKIILVKKT